MPKQNSQSQTIADARGGKGFARLTYPQLQNLLRQSGVLTDQQYIVKVNLKEDYMQILTKAKGDPKK